MDKSVGGTIAKTAFTLVPYFIPGVREVFGWAGASMALAQTLPILAKSLDGLITGSSDDAFGRSMNQVVSYMNRYNGSASRAGSEKFFSIENVGKMVGESAGQLFQQRNIANAAQGLLKFLNAQDARKIGSALSLGYMAATSSNDAWNSAKQMGLDDRYAGLVTVGTMAAIYSLLNTGYIFKDKMFENT